MTYWMWLIAVLVFIGIELCSVQLVSIWLAVGALITSLIVAIFPQMGAGWQVLIFTVASAISLLSTRPLCKKFLRRRKDQQTNLELVLDKVAIVTEDIDNIKGLGAIKINGLVWSARSQNGENISKGELVVFKEIQGNKAIVVKKEDNS